MCDMSRNIDWCITEKIEYESRLSWKKGVPDLREKIALHCMGEEI